jgi:hypothetical protein
MVLPLLAWLLLMTGASRAIGGYRALAGEVVEDLALAKRIKESGNRLRYPLALDALELRLYGTFAALLPEERSLLLGALLAGLVGIGLHLALRLWMRRASDVPLRHGWLMGAGGLNVTRPAGLAGIASVLPVTTLPTRRGLTMRLDSAVHEPSVHLFRLWYPDRTVGEALPPAEGACALFQLQGPTGSGAASVSGAGRSTRAGAGGRLLIPAGNKGSVLHQNPPGSRAGFSQYTLIT